MNYPKFFDDIDQLG